MPTLGGGGGGIGSDGAPGSVWRVGSGAPSNGTGVNGDFYLDSVTGFVYTRASGTYSHTATLAGTAGADGEDGDPGTAGADGAHIRLGSGAPSNGLGVDGDYYIDTVTYNLYYRSTGSYSDLGTLKGSDGADGNDGADGDDGTNGAVWRASSGAPDNGTGVNGDFYLDTTAYNLYERLSGIYNVIANIKGIQGIQGIQGTTGSTGSTGSTGAAGADGATWRNGAGAPSNGTGSNGDYYLDTNNGDVYKRTAGTYSIVGNIKGATGATGPTGSAGASFESTFTAPGLISTYTWVNQGTAVATDQTSPGTSIYLVAAAASGDSNKMLVKSVSGAFTLTCRILNNTLQRDFAAAGLCMRESGTNKIIRLVMFGTSSNVDYFTDSTTFSSAVVALGNIQPNMNWGRLTSDGTTIKAFLSSDGVNWIQVFSEAKATHFTSAPNQVGFFANSNNATFAAGVTLLSWVLT